MQLALLLLAAGLYALSDYIYCALGAVFVLMSYVADCVDGDLARAKGMCSKIGSQLEQMVHWIGGGVLLIGATFGVVTNIRWFWLVGMIALLGETSFHFMYNQLNMYADPNLNYGTVHTLTRWLYVAMPLNTNILILGGITNRVAESVALWGLLSMISMLCVFGVYYRVEVSHMGAMAANGQSTTDQAAGANSLIADH